jgi:hypothetical protein
MEHKTVASVTNKADLQQVFDVELRSDEGKWRRSVDGVSSSLLAWRLALLRSLGPRHAFG